MRDLLQSRRARSKPDPEPGEPGYYLSTAWIGDQLGAGRSIATWLEVVAAPNAAEAMDIVRECPLPTLCWVFADREGHIGMQANGWFPRRAARASTGCCRFRPGTSAITGAAG